MTDTATLVPGEEGESVIWDPPADWWVGSLDDLTASDEPEYDWLVPGLLERGDRVILTGAEGGGKSTLLRQIGLNLSIGRHPFTDQRIDPVRVLLVDLENSKRQVRRKLTALSSQLHTAPATDDFILAVITPGLNLSSEDDCRQLYELARRHPPDVLIIGPLYKMSDASPNEEEMAKPIAKVLDTLRGALNCAVFVEAHPPHTAQGGTQVLRPAGWSGWKRWPEFGLHLSPDGRLNHWRGPRDERDWPVRLRRGDGDGDTWVTGDDGLDEDGQFRPTVMMSKVSRYLVEQNCQGCCPTTNGIMTGLGAKRREVNAAIRELTSTDPPYITAELDRRGNQTFTSVRPFERAPDLQRPEPQEPEIVIVDGDEAPDSPS